MKKARDAKAKANLQPPFYIREIDSKCPEDYRLLVKKDKKDANWEHRDKAFSKDKKRLSSITLFVLINLRPRSPKSVKKVGEGVLQPLGLIPLK